MTENARIKALEQIMPATHGADEDIDWQAAEAVWGTGFPADFVAFMGRFGAGSINGEASILLPLPKPGLQWDPAEMAEETANARQVWEAEGGRAAFDVDPEAIVAWGSPAAPTSCAGSPPTRTPTGGRSWSSGGTPPTPSPCTRTAWPNSCCCFAPTSST